MQELIHTKIHELGVIMKLDAKLYQIATLDAVCSLLSLFSIRYTFILYSYLQIKTPPPL